MTRNWLWEGCVSGKVSSVVSRVRLPSVVSRELVDDALGLVDLRGERLGKMHYGIREKRVQMP